MLEERSKITLAKNSKPGLFRDIYRQLSSFIKTITGILLIKVIAQNPIKTNNNQI